MKDKQLNTKAQRVANDSTEIEETINDLVQKIEELEDEINELEREVESLMAKLSENI